MQQYAVVFFPKINDEKLKTFIKKYNPQGKIIPPHITIVSPMSEINETELSKHIEKVINEIDSFPVHLSGLSRTPDDCLFLLVKEGNEKIVNLHDELYSGILSTYMPTDFPFIPHITLGEFGTNDNELYITAYTEALNLNFDITSSFGEVTVIKGDGINPAIIVKTIKLRS